MGVLSADKIVTPHSNVGRYFFAQIHAIMVKYNVGDFLGRCKMEEKKIGRPRKYEGTESQRRQKANAVYYKKTFKQLNIRIPFSLWEKVQADAKAKRLSIRRFVIKKLEE